MLRLDTTLRSYWKPAPRGGELELGAVDEVDAWFDDFAPRRSAGGVHDPRQEHVQKHGSASSATILYALCLGRSNSLSVYICPEGKLGLIPFLRFCEALMANTWQNALPLPTSQRLATC